MAFELDSNFASSTVATAPSPADSGTSLVVETGHGGRFGTPPYNLVVAPADQEATPENAEIIRVTARSTDSLSTIVRAQEGSTARSIVVGDRIALMPTAKAFADMGLVAPTADQKAALVGNDGTPSTTNKYVTETGLTANGIGLINFHLAVTHHAPLAGYDRTLSEPGIFAPYGAQYTFGSAALVASRAYFARFVPSRDMTVALIAFSVTAQSTGNDSVDVGIYTGSGTTMTRIAASGPTLGLLNSGNGVKTLAVAAALTAGTVYYAAIAVGTLTSATSLFMASAGGVAQALFGSTAPAAFWMAKATTLDASIASASSSLSGNCPLLAVRES